MPRQAWIYLAFTFRSRGSSGRRAPSGWGPVREPANLPRAFGVAAPAIVAVFLSRSRRVIRGNARGHFLARLGLLWLLCWAIGHEAGRVFEGADPTVSSHLVVAVLLAHVDPRAGAPRMRASEISCTLVRWQNWRWLAAAFLFFPVILLVSPRSRVCLEGGSGARHRALAVRRVSRR